MKKNLVRTALLAFGLIGGLGYKDLSACANYDTGTSYHACLSNGEEQFGSLQADGCTYWNVIYSAQGQRIGDYYDSYFCRNGGY
jgi:hypothetical protein